jgi:hypothetical protein
MVRSAIFGALCVGLLSGPAQAEHAVTAEAELIPAVTQEICTVGAWGYDEIRSDCRMETRAAAKANPALNGICTIYYGRRICH